MVWKKVKLRDLWKESKIVSENPNPRKRIKVKLNVKGVEKRPVSEDKGKGTKYFIRKAGQFIYGKQNFHKGAFGIIPDELDGFESSSDIPTFDIIPECNPRWLFYFFKKNNFYIGLEKYSKGTGSKRIHPDKIADLEIPLPERKEQDQIIKKIELQELDHLNLNNNFEYQNKLLTNIKQAILQEAVQGKLVPQDPKDEPASELLKKIKAEKEKLIKEGKIKKQKPLSPIEEDEIPYDLPSGWVWCRLGDVCDVKGGKRIPKGYLLQNKPTDHIYIRVTDMKDGTIKDNKLKYISEEIYQLIKLYTISKDNLYITIAGTIGNVGFVPNKLDNMNLTENAAKIINYGLEKSFLKLLLSSKFARDQFLEKVNQMAQPKLALMRILTTIAPLPPLAEQKRIVEKVDKLIASCDELENKIKENKKYSENLMNAVLRESFEDER